MNVLKGCLLILSVIALNACQPSGNTEQVPSGYPFGYENKNASEGGVDGGGGNAIVCLNELGSIQSAELLDLFEGTSMYSLNIQRSSRPMEEQLAQALQRVPPSSRDLIEAYTGIVRRNMTILPTDTKLDKVHDSFEVVLPKNCKVEQLARFYSQDRILIDGEIWTKLEETDRAALILHEAIYAVNRVFGASDSRRSRHIVASIFDISTNWQDVKINVPEDTLNCIAMNGILFMTAFQNQTKDWILNFEVLGKSLVPSKKIAIIPNLSGFSLQEASKFEVHRGEDKVGLSTKLATSVISNFEGNDIITLEKTWENPRTNEGRSIPGYQTVRYYLSWISGSFPEHQNSKLVLNCSVKLTKGNKR